MRTGGFFSELHALCNGVAKSACFRHPFLTKKQNTHGKRWPEDGFIQLHTHQLQSCTTHAKYIVYTSAPAGSPPNYMHFAMASRKVRVFVILF